MPERLLVSFFSLALLRVTHFVTFFSPALSDGWCVTVGWRGRIGLVYLASLRSSGGLHGERCARLRHWDLHPVGGWSFDDRHRIPWLLRSPARKPVPAGNCKILLSNSRRAINNFVSFLQFFVFLMIILVAEIAGGVWAYMNRADLNKLVQESVRDTVRRDYGKDDVTTKTFDMIQKSLKCCGAESYASWANSAYNGVGEKSPLEIGISALAPTYSVPKSCCADPDSDLCETTRKLGSLGFAASALGIVYTEVYNNHLAFVYSNLNEGWLFTTDFLFFLIRAAHQNWNLFFTSTSPTCLPLASASASLNCWEWSFQCCSAAPFVRSKTSKLN